MSGIQKPPGSPTPPAWVAVYTTFNIPEAQIVAGRLQHEGIPALVNYPIGGSALGINTLGEVNVLVQPQHYRQAEAILAVDDSNALPETTDSIRYLWDDNDDFDDEDDDLYDDDQE